MKLPYAEPDPAGSERARTAKKVRDLATEISRLQPQALTRTNGEEADHGPRKEVRCCEEEEVGARYPANFTKGLCHDTCGLVADPMDYHCFVEAINSPDPTLFEKHVRTADAAHFHCKTKKTCDCPDGEPVLWRGWESPRAGHVYELEGPDSGAVGMAPAPRVGSSELSAEMAEVYALALLRDVPFSKICDGSGKSLCSKPNPENKKNYKGYKNKGNWPTASQIVDELKGMDFFSESPVSSTPHNVGSDGLNRFERNRRKARLQGKELSTKTVFRGSTKGAMKGPYISQFMLIGAGSLNCNDDRDKAGRSNFPGESSKFDFRDGFIPYGSLIIDQRTVTHKACLDYMTDWCSWLDVQNGADVRGVDQFEEHRRFITTPRDLATYVHYDALYEAYLNACLILLAMGVPASKGFPEKSPSGKRTPFATFGGPHILSLVCEVATRCLKAVRRQKFNYHRRARPEALGGRFTLHCLNEDKLGCAKDAFGASLKEIPDEILKAIKAHNAHQNTLGHRNIICRDDDPENPCLPAGVSADDLKDCNYLLPMAFPEGSPMHPAYGAGHATVAGGCVTMLKAFFEMFEDCHGFKERKLCIKKTKKIKKGNKEACVDDIVPIVYEPTDDGKELKKVDDFKDKDHEDCLTIQGELDKLAANISIGRNMAGVHYYSDYYDSLRMGERIAVGILMEQAPTYGEYMETTFKSFDGDFITISGEGGSCPSLSVMDQEGNPVDPSDWWLRHVSGQEFSEDL